MLLVVTVLFIFGIADFGYAQQSDTTQTRKELDLREDSARIPYHSERSANSFLLSESGSYNVPDPKQYYQPPFTGQESLDRAVAFYRQQLENSIVNSAVFQLIGKIAPFVMNRFEFGFYQIYDMPIVDRDHPLLDPQIKEGN